LVNKKDAEPERNERGVGGETIRHPMSGTPTLLKWKADDVNSRKKLKKRVPSWKAPDSVGGGGADFDIELLPSLATSSRSSGTTERAGILNPTSK